MSDELVRNAAALKTLESSMSLSSLAAAVKATESVMLLIDTSGSMAGRPVMQLRETVREINNAGHVPMIAFGGPYDAQVRFVDRVPDPDGGTPLHSAIPFAKTYGANRLVVISDGMPDLQEQSLDEARRFGGKIDVVFIGNPGDPGSFFLDELARVTGGQRFQGDIGKPKELAGTVIGLLMGEVEPAKQPIQGAGFTAAESDVDADEDFEDEDDEEDDDDPDAGDDE